MRLWLAFSAMFKKEIILLHRYFVNTIGTIITLYIVFMLMFFGARGIGGEAFSLGDGLDNLVVGYITWFVLLISYQVIPYTVLQEAQEGTLEQLDMAPIGLSSLVAIKLVAQVIVEMVIVALLLLIIIGTTGISLNIDILSLLPLLALVIASGGGLGFLLGALCLLYKRIHSYLQIVQFAIIVLVAMNPVSFFRWLPVTLPAHWIREVMVQGWNLGHIPSHDWITMLAGATLYLALGAAAFRFCAAKARRQGSLGHF